MNADWHSEHPLSRKASMDERVKWHLQHAEKCACHAIPADVQAVLDSRAAVATSV